MGIRWRRLKAQVYRARIRAHAGFRSWYKSRDFFSSDPLKSNRVRLMREDRIRQKVRDRTIKELTEYVNRSSGVQRDRLRTKLKNISDPSFPLFIKTPFFYEEICRAAANYAMYSIRQGRVQSLKPFDRDLAFYSARRFFTGLSVQAAVKKGSFDLTAHLGTVQRNLIPLVGHGRAAKLTAQFSRAVDILLADARRVGFMDDPLPKNVRAP